MWQSWQVTTESQPTSVLIAAAPAAALAKPRLSMATSGASVGESEPRLLWLQKTLAVGSGHSCVMVALVLSLTTTPSEPSHFVSATDITVGGGVVAEAASPAAAGVRHAVDEAVRSVLALVAVRAALEAASASP